MTEKVILSWSGGKDSAMALYQIQQRQDYEVVTLLTTLSEEYDRVSMHGVRRVLLEEQSRSLGLPLEPVVLAPSHTNEEYEAKMQATLSKWQKAGISGVAFGDIFLADLRKYREDNLARMGMKAIFPIWGRDTAELTRSFVNLGFKAVVTCVDGKVLDKAFAGRVIDASFLAELPSNIDPCGENGEFHSFAFAGPIFKESLPLTIGQVVSRDSFYFCDLLPVDGD
ncbi:MAG: diphthine--ammonia ligase [Chloroflexi bacterium]|nr:diphthine--ammonia ligase [Chloroflexota bacterium]